MRLAADLIRGKTTSVTKEFDPDNGPGVERENLDPTLCKVKRETALTLTLSGV